MGAETHGRQCDEKQVFQVYQEMQGRNLTDPNFIRGVKVELRKPSPQNARGSTKEQNDPSVVLKWGCHSQ